MATQEINPQTGLYHIYDRSPEQMADAVGKFVKNQGGALTDPKYESVVFLQEYIQTFPDFFGSITGHIPIRSEGVEYNVAICVNSYLTAIESADITASQDVNRTVATRLDQLAGSNPQYRSFSQMPGRRRNRGEFIAISTPTSHVIKRPSR